MKRLVKLVMSVFGIGTVAGCTVDPQTISEGANAFQSILNILKLFGILAMVALCVIPIGCVQMYPKVLDTPEGQAAIINAITRSQFQGSGQLQVSEPGFRITVGYVIEARAAGINGSVQAIFSTPPKKPDSVITGKDMVETQAMMGYEPVQDAITTKPAELMKK